MKQSQEMLSGNDILHFLKTLYFYDYSDVFKAASDKAYQDFCRTIRVPGFSEKGIKEKEDGRKAVTEYMRARLTNKDGELDNVSDSVSFDQWHDKTCKGIIEQFSSCAHLHYGQAQKWLNMTCKYLCALEEPHVLPLFPWLHAPIDTIVFERAITLGVRNTTGKAWSTWEENDYKTYQNALRSAVKKAEGDTYPLLLWEWRNWKPAKA